MYMYMYMCVCVGEQVDEEELKKFNDTCVGICCTLFFFMVILNPAMPEETGEWIIRPSPPPPYLSPTSPTSCISDRLVVQPSDRIVPQIPISKETTGDDVGMRSPGAKTKFKTHYEGIHQPPDSEMAVPKQTQVLRVVCASSPPHWVWYSPLPPLTGYGTLFFPPSLGMVLSSPPHWVWYSPLPPLTGYGTLLFPPSLGMVLSSSPPHWVWYSPLPPPPPPPHWVWYSLLPPLTGYGTLLFPPSLGMVLSSSPPHWVWYSPLPPLTGYGTLLFPPSLGWVWYSPLPPLTGLGMVLSSSPPLTGYGTLLFPPSLGMVLSSSPPHWVWCSLLPFPVGVLGGCREVCRQVCV